MLDGVRKFMRERFDKLSSRSPEDIARTLSQRGQARKEQAGRIARDVVEWSKKNRELVADVVQREVRQQIARLGVATKEEVSSLRRRVRDLEGQGPPGKTDATDAPRTSTAKRSVAGPASKRTTKTAAKRSAARKTSTKKAASKKLAPKKAAARKSSRPASQA
jgi:polyhydroxyalkanoate synthesis regulator phasin